jgi:hypothetical protein
MLNLWEKQLTRIMSFFLKILEKLYPKQSIEYKAMETVIEKTKELMREKQEKETE